MQQRLLSRTGDDIYQESIPSWNTAGRPKKPQLGTFGFNSQTSNLEYWNGSRWLKLRMIIEKEEIPNGLG